jgi:hypothetical protein
MTYFEEEEPVDCEIFGLKFKATAAEQRALLLRMSATPQSREWGIARNLIQITGAPVPPMAHEALAERMENADQEMTKLTARLIDEMIAARH